jgi:hypothetical protein
MRFASATHRALIFGLLLASLASLSAQILPKSNAEKKSGPETAAKASDSLEDTLPVSLVSFSEPKPIQSTMSSPGIFLPIVCAPDGTVVVSQPMPPRFIDTRITAASLSKPEGTVTIDNDGVPGFVSLRFLQSFANEEEIAVLASGKKVGNALSTVNRDTESRWFIIVFDRKGSLEKAVQLEIDFGPMHFGILKSGNFVVTGFDNVRKLPRVAIVDTGGTILRFVDLGLDTPEQVRKLISAARPDSVGESDQEIANFTGSQQLVPYQGSLLLVSRQSDLPVLEIGEGGVIRSTVVKRPKDARIDWFIPSDTRSWVVQMTRPGIDANTKRESLLYEVDPDSGELLRRFEGKGELPFIVCAVQNTFITFRIDKPDTKAQLMMMTGNY